MARVLSPAGDVEFSGSNAEAKRFHVNKGLNGWKLELDDVPEPGAQSGPVDLGPVELRIASLEDRALAAEQANVQLVEALTASQERLNEIGASLDAFLSEDRPQPVDLAPIETRLADFEKQVAGVEKQVKALVKK